MRGFNWKFAIVLFLGLVILIGTAFTLRKWHHNHQKKLALTAGLKAYREGQWQQAAENLGRYVSLAPRDTAMLLKYADAQLKIRPLKASNLNQAVGSYREVLNLDKTNKTALKELASIYLSQKLYSESALVTERFIGNLKEPDPDIELLLAWSWIGQQKYSQAYDLLKKLIASDSTNIAAYEAIARLVADHASELTLPASDPQTAEQWYSKAIKNNPQNAAAYIMQAVYYIKQKQNDKAVQALDRASGLNVPDRTAKIRMAQAYIDLHLADKALPLLQQLRKEKPADLLLWQTWANLAFNSKSAQQMEQVARDGLQTLASDPWDFMPVAVHLFIKAGKYDEARKYIEQMKSIELMPARTAYFEGLLASQQQKWYQAAAYWRKAYALGYNSPQFQVSLAQLLSQTGDRQTALSLMHKLSTDYPSDAAVQMEYARLLFQAGRFDRAKAQAARVLQLEPGNLAAALLQTQAKMQLLIQSGVQPGTPAWQKLAGELEQLQAATAKATDTANNELALQYNRLQVALLSGKYDQAQKILAEIKKTNPDQTRVILAEVEILRRQGKDKQARQLILAAVEKHPESADLVEAALAVLSRTGDYEMAVKLLQNCMKKLADDPVQRRQVGLWLADLYQRRNLTDRAIDTLRQLARDLPQDIAVKRRLLQFKSILDNTEQAQKLIDQIKDIEGQAGWQWKFEQAKLQYYGDNFTADYDRIITSLKDILQQMPENLPARMLLAAAYEKMGKTRIKPGVAMKDIQEFLLAAGTYQQAYKLYPRNLAVTVSTITALKRIGQDKEAQSLVQRALKSGLTGSLLSGFLLQDYRQRGQMEEGIKFARELLQAEPENQQTLLLLARMQLQNGNIAAARSTVEDALKSFPANPDFLLLKAQVLITENIQPSLLEARNILSGIVKQHPDRTGAWVALADLAAREKEYDMAINYIDKGLAARPGQRGLLLLKARLQARRNSPEALATLQLLRKNNPADVEVTLQLADTLIRLQRSDEAAELLKGELDRAAPANKKLLHLAWINTLYKAGQSGLAQQEIDKLKKTYSADPAVILAQAGLWIHEKQWDKLSNRITQWYSDLTQPASLLLQVANQLQQAAQPAASLQTAEKILRFLERKEPDNDLVLQALAMLLQTTDRTDEAAQYYRKILQHRPDYPIAVNNLSWIICENQHDPRQALELVQKGLQNAPKNYLDLVDTRGMIYYRLGEYDKAARDFAQCTKLYPDYNPAIVASYFHLAQALEKLNKRQEASANLKKALELNKKLAGLSPADEKAARQLGETLASGV